MKLVAAHCALVTFAVLSVAQCTALGGTEMTADRVEAALRRRIEECRAWAGAPVYLEWTVQKMYVPDEQQLVALVNEVANAPDHPEKHMVEAYVRRSAGNDPAWEWAVWFWSSSEFRYHMSLPSAGAQLMPMDQVRTNASVWDMTPGQLSVYDKGRLPGNATPEASRRAFQYDIGEFLYPGVVIVALGFQEQDRVDLRVSVTQEGHWEAVASSALMKNFSVTLAGSWEHDAGGLQTRSAKVINSSIMSNPDVDILPVHYEFYDYNTVQLSTVTLSVPHTVRAWNHAGRALETRSLSTIKPIDRTEFDTVTKLPSRESPDRIYGWHDTMRVAHFDEEGMETVTNDNPGPGRPAARNMTRHGATRPEESVLTRLWNNIFMVFGIACGILALGVLFFRRFKRVKGV